MDTANSHNSKGSQKAPLLSSVKCQPLLDRWCVAKSRLSSCFGSLAPELQGVRQEVMSWLDERRKWVLGDLRRCGRGIVGFLMDLRTGKRGVKRGFWKNPRFYAAVLAGCLLGGNFLLMARQHLACVAYYGDERIGLISSQKAAEGVRLKVEEALERELGQDVFLPSSLVYKTCMASRVEMDSLQQFEAALRELPWMTSAVEVCIDGRPVFVLADRKAAQELLNRFRDGFLSGESGEKVESFEFQEEIAFRSRRVAVQDVLSVEDALTALNGGTSRVKTYVVKEGDNLWSIARAHGLLVEDIFQANPQLTSERLDVGQEIRLAVEEPLLHVMITSTLVKKEVLPPETRTQLDDSLRRGQTKVISSGESGEAMVVYRLVRRNDRVVERQEIERQVLKEPKPRIVAKGTKSTVTAVAARGSGSGVLRWPVSGRITSGFGYRGGEFHGAIDIAAAAGTAVLAAAGGRVVSAGWQGGYGYTVAIDHGNGMVTRYAHLSRISVGTGESVAAGEVIGAVGSTGRSTGPHLHFEVVVGGSKKNPLNYLR